MKEALDAIRRLTVDGVAPTFEELGADLGLSSKSSVHRLVHALATDGLITFDPNSSRRSMQIVGGPLREAMERWSDAEIRRVALDLREIGRERGLNRVRVPA